MSGQVFSFILLFWVLAVCVSSVVRGQVQVIGSSQPIRASVGDDVILPCRCDPEVNAEPLTVEWSRTELKPHPSDRLKRVPYVHLYRDHREDLDMKIPAFVDRTQMFPGQLRAGNVSLRIRNLTLADSGTYRCFIPNLRSRDRDALISLIVDPVVDAVTPTPDPTFAPKQRDLDPVTEPGVRGFWPILAAVVLFLCLCVGAVAYVRFRDFIPKLQKPIHHRNNAVSEKGDDTVLDMETTNLTRSSSETTASSAESIQRSTREAG